MADIVSRQKRSEMMSGIRGKDTKPEVFIRRLLHRSGFRFRLHGKDLPGKPDIVLPKWDVVIFVHGCFWHGHQDCDIFRLPKSRTEFWEQKITANVTRDEKTRQAYNESRWRLIEVWECAIKGKHRLKETDLSDLLCDAIKKRSEQHISFRGQTL